MPTLPAHEARQTWGPLLARVLKERISFTITRRGKPIAILSPYPEPAARLTGGETVTVDATTGERRGGGRTGSGCPHPPGPTAPAPPTRRR